MGEEGYLTILIMLGVIGFIAGRWALIPVVVLLEALGLALLAFIGGTAVRGAIRSLRLRARQR